MRFILASSSPRRQDMLRSLGIDFEISKPDISELRLRGEPAVHFVTRLSQEKAFCIAQKIFKIQKKKSGDLTVIDENERSKDWCILAADTTVVVGKNILNKPKDKTEAVKMLSKLSGQTHEVITGYCLLGCVKGQLKTFVSHQRTKVSFCDMPLEFWKWYVSTGEPMDKAGAYAAQGIGLSFIEKFSGSYSNVVGLPLSHVLAAFKKVFGRNLFGNS